jgi:VCBS repeat-containing protein
MKKTTLLGLAVGLGLFAGTSVKADSIDNFIFNKNLGNIGTVDTFTSGAATLIVAGYDGPGILSALFEKNQGPTEFGLGLLGSGPDNEISGDFFIQLSFKAIAALNPSKVTLGLNSIQVSSVGSDNYSVWASNTQGQLGTLLASNQTGTTFDITDAIGTNQFISITAPGAESAPSATVLLDSVDVTIPVTTPTPEIGSAFMLLTGLVLFFIGRVLIPGFRLR